MTLATIIGQLYRKSPYFIRRPIFKTIKFIDAPGRYFRTKADAKIPRAKLQEQHVQNCQIVLNRAAMVAALPKGGIAAELGVDNGAFSRVILDGMKPSKLHLVDVWESGRYNDEKFLNVKALFQVDIDADRVQITRKYSTEAPHDFPDGHFDFVYVDTDHSYQTTAEELAVWAPKMAKGGVIAGHDYKMGNWKSANRYGVIEAVHEFCVNEGWELLYITADPTESQSFAIRKIA
ncbi:class I SAM-dependent methyltransferase [Amylibacter sp. SFDW26]|uniref:class I SAM-dependent methyltransferase n=1 Tax=Amylibacter sp. SFDW26 TaxID=2652722 RepID=UPI001262336B|nr:class I SAM-dependent methyltransferase [Amylibacter sp. SFDW26]KAB7615365.1 class I SAM-dependent methyltransferase [Amylibacter sp. SFDW26]